MLAAAVGVSGQAVTNWLKGEDFPRPATLQKLASVLSLDFDKLVLADVASQPVIAFRKKGGAKTTEEHVLRARAMGAMLKPLANYLPARQSLRTQISDTSLAYVHLQATVAAVRSRLGTVPILDHSADLAGIRQIGMTVNLAQFDAATGSQPTTQLAEQGVARIDNSYTLGYSSCIYCVCTQRRKPCATPPLIYGHCPRSET